MPVQKQLDPAVKHHCGEPDGVSGHVPSHAGALAAVSQSGRTAPAGAEASMADASTTTSRSRRSRSIDVNVIMANPSSRCHRTRR
jgi:hypothetical protein